jgi:hypothetical protein
MTSILLAYHGAVHTAGQVVLRITYCSRSKRHSRRSAIKSEDGDNAVHIEIRVIVQKEWKDVGMNETAMSAW